MSDGSKMRALNFIDLPSEIRDMIYLNFRPYSWIDITQMPSRIHQPSISMVSREVRKEFLDIFYNKNRFMLDLRGWKHVAYPKRWTPNEIFTRWITAIGDDNAARLRSLTFYGHNFAIVFTISNVAPRIAFRLRANRADYTRYDVELSEDAPAGYDFATAIQRARNRVDYVVKQLVQDIGDQPLTVQNICHLLDIVKSVKPVLCTRMGVGWKAAYISDDPSVAPEARAHKRCCDECSYSRITEMPTSR